MDTPLTFIPVTQNQPTQPTIEESIYVGETTPSEIEKIIRNLPNKSSTGDDGISPNTL